MTSLTDYTGYWLHLILQIFTYLLSPTYKRFTVLSYFQLVNYQLYLYKIIQFDEGLPTTDYKAWPSLQIERRSTALGGADEFENLTYLAKR